MSTEAVDPTCVTTFDYEKILFEGTSDEVVEWLKSPAGIAAKRKAKGPFMRVQPKSQLESMRKVFKGER